MNTLTWILTLILLAITAGYLLRIVFQLVSWRLVALALGIAILTTTGLLNLEPILTELDHTITNLFGTPTPTEGRTP